MAYCNWKSYNGAVDPFEIFSLLEDRPHRFLLESSMQSDAESGRFSFVGADPYLVLPVRDRKQMDILGGHLARNRVLSAGSALPFLSGAVGYLAYEAGAWFEPRLGMLSADDPGIPTGFFCLYNTVIAVDHWADTVHIVTHGAPENNTRAARLLCSRNEREAARVLEKSRYRQRRPARGVRAQPATGLRTQASREDFCRAVSRAKAYIAAGDIYQVNLTQRFEAVTTMSAASIYSRLRRLSPSHFAGVFDAGEFQVISSSPEEFLRVRQNIIRTRPMKGTRRRGANRREDAALKDDLARSVKDRAELLMIVDLLRNDLGKICRYGSVSAPVLRQIEAYATVYQTTAIVEGILADGVSFGDIMEATFPGGSITGCPKLRAMEIIAELETCGRSLYTGCFGYLSFCGNLDLNILIRTILKKDARCYFGVGSGIVADSRPRDEYEETLIKARALTEALGAVHAADHLS